MKALPVLHASKPSHVPTDAVLERAGRWFLRSGIQDASGAVARYYQSDSRRNAPVSTEITGYAVSALTYLSNTTGDDKFLAGAERAAQYLVHHAWSEQSATFPFEPVSNGDIPYAYFFDCGIIARGLLALWRASGNREYFERAKECGLSMAFDFMAEEAMHPVLRLPDKQPLSYDARWSRRPGCYQLKSALAWRELAAATGQRELASAFERMLAYSLATHAAFLPSDVDDQRVMDRLHAYGYFLESLLAVAERPECAAALESGMHRVQAHLGRIAPEFVRSDVYAQLLRIRLFGAKLGIIRLDEEAAQDEAARLAEFQAQSPDRRIDGAFWFGRRRDAMLPFANPVSTAFAAQALALWREYQESGVETPVIALI
jgi:hypothetical protein